MKLFKFERTSPKGAEVAINPDLVAAVVTYNGKTVIQLAAPDTNGHLSYRVVEDFDFVVSRLQGIERL